MFSSKPLVFISYSRKDKVAVEELRRRLATQGVQLWMDTRDIVAGEWRREIRKGLRHSNFFLACLSQNTVQRGEVLQYEYDSALEIQRERLEGEIYVIPVRLEPCDLPDCFKHLQCLDVYEPAGWDALVRALRSKVQARWSVMAAMAAIVALAAFGGYESLRPTAESELLAARARGKAAVGGNSVQLGVTLWKMQPSEDSDPPSIREIVHPPPTDKGASEPAEWTPVRLPEGGMFHREDRFQVGIEVSRTGYLYVVNRSFRKDGSTGPASLIFPTARIRGGDDQMWPGTIIRLPARTSKPPYWEFTSSRSDYSGELLEMLLAPQPLEGLAAIAEAAPIDDETLAAWEKQFGGGVLMKSYAGPQLRLTPEEAAARDQGAALGRTAPSPEFIFEADRSSNTAMFCRFRIPVGAKL
jgi:hypothetical protein